MDELTDILFRLKRGLAGYVSYLAACEMNQAFSEYLLYEPILRILTARGFNVQCEYPCPETSIEVATRQDSHSRGDKRRIDFHARNASLQFVIEVKWIKDRYLNVSNDAEKLRLFKAHFGGSKAFLCVFGRKAFLQGLRLDSEFSERGEPVYAEFRKTRYGCRVFELR